MKRLISLALICVFCYCFVSVPTLSDGVHADDYTPPDSITDTLPCIDPVTGEPCEDGGTGGGGDDPPWNDPDQ